MENVRGKEPSLSDELFLRRISSSYTSVESSWNCCRVRRVSFCLAVEREFAGSGDDRKNII